MEYAELEDGEASPRSGSMRDGREGDGGEIRSWGGRRVRRVRTVGSGTSSGVPGDVETVRETS